MLSRLVLWTQGAAALNIGNFFSPRQLSLPPTVSFRLLNTFPHDPKAFCQGLYYEQPAGAGRYGTLLESTGIYGASSIRRVEIETGQVLNYTPLPDK